MLLLALAVGTSGTGIGYMNVKRSGVFFNICGLSLGLFWRYFTRMRVNIPEVNFSSCPHSDLFDATVFMEIVVKVIVESLSISRCLKAQTNFIALALSTFARLTKSCCEIDKIHQIHLKTIYFGVGACKEYRYMIKHVDVHVYIMSYS